MPTRNPAGIWAPVPASPWFPARKIAPTTSEYGMPGWRQALAAHWGHAAWPRRVQRYEGCRRHIILLSCRCSRPRGCRAVPRCPTSASDTWLRGIRAAVLRSFVLLGRCQDDDCFALSQTCLRAHSPPGCRSVLRALPCCRLMMGRAAQGGAFALLQVTTGRARLQRRMLGH